MSAALVAVLMGSSSDYPVMKGAVEILDRFSVTHEVRVLSAHRTPHDMLEYAATAEVAWSRGAHRRSWRRRASARHAGRATRVTGHRCSDRYHQAAGRRLVAVDRADADRRAGRDCRDRQRPQRRACSPCACSPSPMHPCAATCTRMRRNWLRRRAARRNSWVRSRPGAGPERPFRAGESNNHGVQERSARGHHRLGREDRQG